MLDIYQILANT